MCSEHTHKRADKEEEEEEEEEENDARCHRRATVPQDHKKMQHRRVE